MTLARVDQQGSTLTIMNANPARRGALSPDLYAAIREALERAQDPKVRAIIFASEGGFFCSGGDLNTLKERAALSLEQRRAKVQELHDLVAGLRAAPVPIIAAVEGGAAGAGLSLALACDMIVATQGAKFTASYVKAGVVPDAGLTSALSRMLPRQLVSEMCLLARSVAAGRLADLGVVNLIAEDPLAEAQVLADTFAKGPRKAQGIIKGLVSSAYELSETEQLVAEREAMIRAVVDTEAQIGITAFLSKQTPEYP
ncbi:oxepin-CoA hydrolase, alternative type [Planktotalea arctica]|uniref:oxepin-CoA hydrolase, alternative type n=1 Tax=Planktotalea arctica TaxID=1481893 RepID=UPI003218F90E